MEELYQSRYTGPEIDRRLGLMAGNFLWIKWSATFPVVEMLDEPGPYIGIYTGEADDPPEDPAEYKWYLNKGDTGAAGADGVSGVYLGETEPTDPDVNIWIAPTGGFDIIPPMTQSEYDAIPPEDIDNDVLYVIVPDEV